MYSLLTKNFFVEAKVSIIFFIILIMITFPVEGVIMPQLYSKFFEALRANNLSSQLKNLNLKESFQKKNAMGLLFIIIGIWFSLIILFFIKNKHESYLLPKLLTDIRAFLFEKYIIESSENYSETKQGETISRILHISREIKNLFHLVLSDFLPTLVTCFFGTIAITIISKEIGSIVIGAFTLYILFSIISIPKLLEIAINRENMFIKNTQNYTNNFSNLLNVYLNNQEKQTIQENNQNEHEYFKISEDQFYFSNLIRLGGATIFIVMFILSLIILFKFKLKNKISNTSITSITLILIYFMTNIRRIQDHIPAFATIYATVECSRDFVEKIINTKEDESEQETNTYDSIKISNLTFRYNEKTILDDIHFEVKSGEKVALIGPSGSGKTTLMKLLLKLHKIPEDAEVLIGDQNIKELSRSSLRENITYINQKTTLLDASILENIMFGNYASEQEVTDLLEKYDLKEIFDKVGGIHASAGVTGSNLSLGMQKVVIIIRGILRESSMILIDEPLAGLDSKTRTKILNLIRKETEDKTIVVISHDKEVFDIVDRIIDIKSL